MWCVELVCKRNVFRRGKIFFSGIYFSLVLLVENDLEIYVSMFYKDALNKSRKRLFHGRREGKRNDFFVFCVSLIRRKERAMKNSFFFLLFCSSSFSVILIEREEDRVSYCWFFLLVVERKESSPPEESCVVGISTKSLRRDVILIKIWKEKCLRISIKVPMEMNY